MTPEESAAMDARLEAESARLRAKATRPLPVPQSSAPRPIRGRAGARKVAVKSVRTMLELALRNKGGVAYLERLADEEPRAFAALLARCIPQAVAVELTNVPVVTLRNFATGRIIDAEGSRIEEPAAWAPVTPAPEDEA